MREYPTQKIVHVLANIADIKERVSHHQARQVPLPQNQREVMQSLLLQTLPWLEELELVTTKKHCAKFAAEIVMGLSCEIIVATADMLRQDLQFRLEDKKLFAISPQHENFYDNPVLAGEDFRDNWKNGNAELMEAGNCFALDRHTACACHLMRAVEIVLRSLEDALKITPQSRDTWGIILNAIEKKRGCKEIQIKGQASIPAIAPALEWSANAQFFEGCYTFINGVKTSCRDNVFHIKSTYDETKADRLFGSVCSFLSHASEHLKELT